jgi:hypothetical protein
MFIYADFTAGLFKHILINAIHYLNTTDTVETCLLK